MVWRGKERRRERRREHNILSTKEQKTHKHFLKVENSLDNLYRVQFVLRGCGVINQSQTVE